MRRRVGATGISDLLLVVLVADASQNAMSSDYKSLTEGVVLVGTIAFWDFFLDFLSHRFSMARRIIRPTPLLLIKDGHLQRQNMKQEMITYDELMARLRENRIDNVKEVKKCYMEDKGHISVITNS